MAETTLECRDDVIESETMVVGAFGYAAASTAWSALPYREVPFWVRASVALRALLFKMVDNREDFCKQGYQRITFGEIKD